MPIRRSLLAAPAAAALALPLLVSTAAGGPTRSPDRRIAAGTSTPRSRRAGRVTLRQYC
ncbi:hypothetical protein ACFC0D_08365 [Streptomyces sp. NPDC056222]|uniref:hypothetical protein n=1 Tax=Streptomyces sp. NPDC056222 TaxID=3345749 RepID=UPI0035DE0665